MRHKETMKVTAIPKKNTFVSLKYTVLNYETCSRYLVDHDYDGGVVHIHL